MDDPVTVLLVEQKLVLVWRAAWWAPVRECTMEALQRALGAFLFLRASQAAHEAGRLKPGPFKMEVEIDPAAGNGHIAGGGVAFDVALSDEAVYALTNPPTAPPGFLN
jgi:hypothetical protein